MDCNVDWLSVRVRGKAARVCEKDKSAQCKKVMMTSLCVTVKITIILPRAQAKNSSKLFITDLKQHLASM